MRNSKDSLEIVLHKYQSAAYFSNKRITALISGIQGGKTRIGGLWMMRRIALYDRPDNTFIIAAPTFKLMAKSTLPWALSLLKGCGHFDAKFNRFILNGGGVVWFASMLDDDSCEGATNVQGIWIDEAGKIRYNSWINLLARSSFRMCPIMITTTPYALNWLYNDIYKPWKNGELNDVKIVQFRSVDNPHFPKAEYERQKKILDPRVFKRKYGGTFQKMAGLVYPDIDRDNWIEPFHIDENRYFVCGGIDLGWQNPFAIVVRAIAMDGSYDYQVAEFSRSFVDIKERIEILSQFRRAFKIQIFYCDSEDPGQIALFNNAGLSVIPVEKGPGSVARGIIQHNEIIKNKKYKMFKGRCKKSNEEYETYHYPEEEGQEKNVAELPIAVNDHLMDANRYVTMMTQSIREAAEEAKKYKKWDSPLEELQRPSSVSVNEWYEKEGMTVI